MTGWCQYDRLDVNMTGWCQYDQMDVDIESRSIFTTKPKTNPLKIQSALTEFDFRCKRIVVIGIPVTRG